MPAGRRILFTSISGVAGSSLEALERLREYCQRRYGRSIRLLRAEEYLSDEAHKLGLLPPAAKTSPRSSQMIQAMACPKPLLVNCHKRALKRLLHENDLPECSDDIFLFAHTCFYHQKSRELFTLLDEDVIRTDFRPDVIVTLIDDVEHIHSRLRDKGQMLAPLAFNYEGINGPVTTCLHLTGLLHWRGGEFGVAEALAPRAGENVAHFLVAVKHPLVTVGALLYEPNRPIVYLSHPITTPRRYLNSGQTEQFKEFIRGLHQVCQTLRQVAVVFEPTTIDEFRLRTAMPAPIEGGNREQVLLPQLMARWPFLPADKTMWTTVDESANPIDPNGHFPIAVLDAFQRQVETGQCDPADAKTRDLDFMGVLLGSLVKGTLLGGITDQVAARDYKLVEQSKHMLVVRPAFGGTFSRGVEHEIRHHCKLSQDPAQQRGGIWIVTTGEDCAAYRKNRLQSWVVKQFPELDAGAAIAGVSVKQDAHDIVGHILGQTHKRHDGQNPLDEGPAAAAAQQQAELAQDLQNAMLMPYSRIAEELGCVGIVHEKYCKSWPTDDQIRSIIKEMG